MSLLELEGISKTYGGCEVLRNISLQVDQGELVTVMGSSGSGKSTMLYIMGGMESPTLGTVTLSGRNIHSLTDRQKSVIRQSEIGFVFQSFNLVHNLSAEENILLPALFAGKRQREMAARLTELLVLFGLYEHRRKIPSQLSGGQQQRVAIARAVINNPGLILADEPTGNLDSDSALVVMELLQRINREYNTAVVHITHNPELAGFGSRIVHMKDGRITADYAAEPEREAKAAAQS